MRADKNSPGYPASGAVFGGIERSIVWEPGLNPLPVVSGNRARIRQAGEQEGSQGNSHEGGSNVPEGRGCGTGGRRGKA